ncbi:type IV secretion system protein VirB10 [Rhizobiales bacterium GAS113]|nr:type IV secretion system protein VirB10 [Rhizobiales bacterium GAS113]
MSDNERKAEADLAAQLRLRPERPRVTRLSRRVLVALAGLASAAVVGMSFWALQSGRNRQDATELYDTSNRTTADGLSTLPHDYTGLPKKVPQLGPPLPGDLGRPILRAEQGPAAPGVDAAAQRIAQEQEAALTSRLFSTVSMRSEASVTQAPATAQQPSGGQVGGEAGSASGLDPDSLQNMQDRKLAFLNGPVDRRTVSPDRLQNPASAYVVQAGSVIPAALITGIRSDLPGQVTAQVTENVYDSPTGRFLLVPQGTKLIGIYDSQVAFGQDRVALVWTRLVMPNGKSIVLERQPGADTQGYSGLEDEVDHHWMQLFEAALLSSLLGVGTEIGSSGNSSNQNDIVQALRRGSSDSLNQTGQQVVRRNLNIQPTLTIRPGFPVRVIVNRDLMLAPYQS